MTLRNDESGNAVWRLPVFPPTTAYEIRLCLFSLPYFNCPLQKIHHVMAKPLSLRLVFSLLCGLVLPVSAAVAPTKAPAPAKPAPQKKAVSPQAVKGAPAAAKPGAPKSRPAAAAKSRTTTAPIQQKKAASPQAVKSPPAAAKPSAPKSRSATSAAPAAAKIRTIMAPVHLNRALATGRVKLKSMPVTAGKATAWFDGNARTTATVTPRGNVSVWEFEFAQPVEPELVEIQLAGVAPGAWTLSGAPAVSTARAMTVASRPVAAGALDQVLLKGSGPQKKLTLELTGQAASSHPALAEFTLWTNQAVRSIEIEAISSAVSVGGALPLKAVTRLSEGGVYNATPEAKWTITPPTRGEIDAWSRFVAKEPGKVTLTATFEGVSSDTLVLDSLAKGQPDWDVLFIEKQPRVESGQEAPQVEGQPTYWFAHIKNYGTADAGPVKYEWRVDGEVVRSAKLPGVERFKQTEVLLTLKHDGKPHQVEIVIDPENSTPETCEGNNRISVNTAAIPVGFWSEDAAMRHFHMLQNRVDPAGNSFEDWAQRQIGLWNKTASENGSTLQFRLDRVIVVGDGMLPLAGSYADAASAETSPDQRDSTIRYSFGVPASAVTGSGRFARLTSGPESPLRFDSTLVRRITAIAPASASSAPAAAKAGAAGD